MKKLILFVFVTLLICSSKVFASGGGCTGTEIPCTSANPFCSAISYNFPNETSTCAPTGPEYGCLASQPNPVWYYMQINQSGNIQLDLEQTTGPNGTGSGLDVDFALYGPYSSREQTDPSGPSSSSGNERCVRGGSFILYESGDFRCGLRNHFKEDLRGGIGFRLTAGPG